jgi:cytochrome c-type biogenesis protein
MKAMSAQEVSLGALLAVFAGGLLSFFSPCVAPLAPGYIGYLSGRSVRAEADGEGAVIVQRSSLAVSALFIGGFSTTFILLGLLSGAFGRLLVAYRPVMETSCWRWARSCSICCPRASPPC